MQRMETLLARQGVWQSAAEIAEPDAETGLKHALALHYKSVELNRELKAAETGAGRMTRAKKPLNGCGTSRTRLPPSMALRH